MVYSLYDIVKEKDIIGELLKAYKSKRDIWQEAIEGFDRELEKARKEANIIKVEKS